MEFPIVDLTDDVDRKVVEKAVKRLSEIRTELREEKDPAVRLYASEIMQVILMLREAME